MISVFKPLALAVLTGFAATSVSAQDVSSETQLPQKQYVIDLGIGGILKPKYASSDSYLFAPFPIISVGRFYVPGAGQVVDGRVRSGIFFFPSFGFVGERSSKDNKDLTGTKDVDWALELGLGAGYRSERFRVFAEVRQGINGHTGQVGQLGLDGIFYPAERFELSIGPRAGFASGEYMDTYFGVTSAESAASGGKLATHKTNAGFKSVGMAARVSYDWTEKTRLHLQADYDRLIGDAADSPITDQGSENQFSIGVGVSYKFSFDLF
ncbi:MipA/OmpV family protein [Roseibium algae]|uniref:MipA/OmpV family protein n=1 Tax=Roseibium algae TaxID=3123038 RepID=A0ABU8TNX9_9HYPH